MLRRLPLLAMLLFLLPVPSVAQDEPLLRRISALEDARRPAREELVRYLEHEDATVRARAVRALGRLQDATTLPLLERALDGGDPVVQAEAAFALSQMPGAQEALLRALEGPAEPATRLVLIEGLGKQGKEGGVVALRQLLLDPQPEARATALVALGRYAVRRARTEPDLSPLPAGTRQDVEARLKDPAAPVRAAAAYALSKIQESASAEALAPVAWDEDPAVRLMAARALAVTAVPASRESLAALATDPDWRVRAEVAKGLGKVGETGVPLLRTLLGDEDPHVRRAALTALGVVGPPAAPALDDVRRGLGDPEIAVQAAAAEALVRVGRGLGDLQALAGSPAWQLRRSAARGAAVLVESRSSELNGVLRLLARDVDRRVAEAALETMAEWPDPAFRPVVLERLREGDAALAAVAAGDLARWKDPEAGRLIAAAYAGLKPETDSETMQALLEALGEVEGPEARSLLATAAASPDANLRRVARKALKQPEEGLPGAAPTAVVEAPLPPAEVRARVRTTRGEFVLVLHGADAPRTVANFLRLVGEDYYEALTFHRVVPDFVVQGGDPRGDGWGGPGYSIRCEVNPRHFERGAVGMALAGKDTGGSQWFVCHSAQPHLDGNFTVFATVVDGMGVVDSLQEGDGILGITIE